MFLPFCLLQSDFVCVAVLDGNVKLFYSFNGAFGEEKFIGKDPNILQISGPTAQTVSFIACVTVTKTHKQKLYFILFLNVCF